MCKFITMLEIRSRNIITNAILTVVVIYITSVSAMKEMTWDFRYPLDARIIQGTLNQSNFVRVLFEANKNKTGINYYVMDSTYSCGPYKQEMSENSVFLNEFRIVSLSQDKILLLPFEYRTLARKMHLVKMEILHFSSCHKIKVVLPTEINKPTDLKITRYVDSFDIYFKDLYLCGNRPCRKSYDLQGNVISTAFVEFNSNTGVPLVKPVGAELRSNIQVAITFSEGKKNIHLVTDNKMNMLTEVGLESVYPTSNKDLTPEISTSYGVISIIYRMNFTSLICMQFDLGGNLRFKTVIKYNYFIRTARILNSPDGGVYLIASECERDHCSDNANQYLTKKLNVNGKEVGSFSMTLPLPGILEDISFYEHNESYCLTRAQLSLGAVGTYYFKKVDINTKCFTDEDFSG